MTFPFTDHQGDQSTESPDGDAADSDGNRKRNHSPIVFDKDEEKEEPPPLPGPGMYPSFNALLLLIGVSKVRCGCCSDGVR